MAKLIFSALLALSISAFAADPAKQTAGKMDPKAQEMMKKMADYATPGKEHKVLAEMAGTWKYTSKWWETADGKPQENTGTSKMKMVLGGRWLQQEMKGKAMGMPFEGMGLTGFNNQTKKFESKWMDTMSTGSMDSTGTMDDATKTIKEAGTYACPITGMEKRPYRAEWQIVDKNKMTYAMWGTGMDPKGPEFKQMEMTFTRTK